MKHLAKWIAVLFCTVMITSIFSCKAEVESVVLSSIEITSPAVKTEYLVGEDLDTSGLEVTAYYSDGTSKIIDDWLIDGFESSVANDNLEIKVIYKGKEIPFYVKILKILKIEITKPANKTEYCINEVLDTTGLEVSAVLNNGTRQVVSGWTTEFDNTLAGNSISVKIKYEDNEDSYVVNIYRHSLNNGILCQRCNAYDFYEIPVDVETFEVATSDSTYVYFGVFPKSVLPADSSVTINETERIIMGANTYYKGSDGNYYAKVIENSGEFYYEQNSILPPKYRYTDGTLVKREIEESPRYFKIEPIKWKVLTTDYNGTGKALLLAEDILTANVPYYVSISNRTIGGKTVYSKNYKYSTIRAYLNGTYEGDDTQTKTYAGKGFLQTAFTNSAQLLISTTTVNNSEETANILHSTYVDPDSYCDDTEDKIFLLSASEVMNSDFGFTDSVYTCDARIRLSTDYALANSARQSSDYNDRRYGGDWWLRSPNHESPYAYGVSDRDIMDRDTDNRIQGVVPALTISF